VTTDLSISGSGVEVGCADGAVVDAGAGGVVGSGADCVAVGSTESAAVVVDAGAGGVVGSGADCVAVGSTESAAAVAVAIGSATSVAGSLLLEQAARITDAITADRKMAAVFEKCCPRTERKKRMAMADSSGLK